jgi:hypothetical protein
MEWPQRLRFDGQKPCRWLRSYGNSSDPLAQDNSGLNAFLILIGCFATLET